MKIISLYCKYFVYIFLSICSTILFGWLVKGRGYCGLFVILKKIFVQMTLTFSSQYFFLINTKILGQNFSTLFVLMSAKHCLMLFITSIPKFFLLYHMQFSIPPPPPPNKIWPLVLQLKYYITNNALFYVYIYRNPSNIIKSV